MKQDNLAPKHKWKININVWKIQVEDYWKVSQDLS